MSSLSSPKVGFVSLGCPKALVDSERILTQLKLDGYAISNSYDDADVVVVNTCGFIDDAVAESLDAIGEALAENGKVIVTGCMGAEPEQIEAAYPGVLSITGPQQYESVLDAVHRALPPAHNPHLDLVPPQGLHLPQVVDLVQRRERGFHALDGHMLPVFDGLRGIRTTIR